MGLTATALAKQIGISQQQLSRYENGINKIYANQLVSICFELKTPISWFFKDFFPNEKNKNKKK
ncbi:helix-turn-helix domain-containing protein [Xenorhabdus bovienii]|uniref:helix-turn-helix domain-containing protein n=1 Tax=Xenorhabdus bovienii TaxID=40576 RepID=UPI0023B2A62C|nr:helix-turn-helix transcriptional regulator [Xenorhabdus bovienii]